MKNNSMLGGLIIVLVVVTAAYLLTKAPAPGTGSVATSTQNGSPAPVAFYCGENNSFSATFATSTVALLFSDGRTLSLPQTMSGSGIRYEATSTGADLLFVSKGDWGAFTDSASTTDFRYQACTAALVAPSDAPGYNTYENIGKSFSLTFPDNFSVAGIEPGYGPGWTAPATTTGMILAKLTVPQSFEKGTNFAGAWLTVGTSADPQAVADCTKTLAGTAAATEPAIIGGVTFTKLEFTGVGAGNIYDTTSYRAVKDNQCYAVEYTVHYGNIQNYPAGKVQAFNEQKVTTALDEVARSFRFK